ncbi:diguanylate cyclase/phosphodiesterase with PAS/PAC sensor(s) [Jannaschia sp. CCS1]|nr:diguanylate cyclase/phosphodiesterase with PAS/PAC sensor(s) [Jannaschia sp. CCS1]
MAAEVTMSIEILKTNFMELTSDAVVVGYVAPGERVAVLKYVNAAFTAQFGYAPDDILGKTAATLHDEEDWAGFKSTVDGHIAAHRTQFSTDAKMVRADGSRFWASASLIVVENEDEGGRYVCATFRDISNLKEAETTAQNAHGRLISALNAYPDPIVIYDKDLLLVCWNDAYAIQMTGRAEGLQVGMHLKDVLRRCAFHGQVAEAKGREEAWIAQTMSPENLAVVAQDIEMEGDIHQRLMRSRASNGDYVVFRLDTTEMVRQRRASEAARSRLLAALNTYPAPFAIYDADDRLVVWNNAYAASMAKDIANIQVGLHRRDVAAIAVRDGILAEAVGNETEWISKEHQEADLAKPVQDLELAGDIHHRLLRSRAENGDLVMLRIDTTEIVRHRRALEKTQDRLISAINAYPDPFAIYDRDQNLVIWNPAYAQSMTDDPDSLYPGISLKELLLGAARCGRIPVSGMSIEDWVEEYYSEDLLKPGAEDFEFVGDTHFRMVRSRAENEEHVVLSLNITEVVRQRRAVEEYAKKLEKANAAITRQAQRDELTGLGNRRYLGLKFDAFVARRARNGGEIAALHIDLDRFKQINDTMGHAAGDKVLLETSKRVQRLIGPDDVVARIGGDEFVVLIYEPTVSQRPETLTGVLLDALSRPTQFEGRECRFGASIGLARTPLSGVDELLTNSDVALYKAKRRGRSQVSSFDRSDLEELRCNKTLADDILRGIEGGEFVPFYQPQVDAKTGRVLGLEALARWDHPQKGVLAPSHFLQIATDLNVAADIDRMIFEAAIDECSNTFQALGQPPTLSFNVSARRVSDDNIQDIAGRVRQYPGQVCFELLETIFLEEEGDEFLNQLDRLRELGIGLEVDDFGSGRASVIALQRIAPDRLKIDRRLVAPIAHCAKGVRLLRSIVEIGLSLEMGVTAEGVETREQADILAEFGCDRLQGYLFAKPMGFADMAAFMERSQGLDDAATVARLHKARRA